jgi:hypothetical protein
MIFIFDIPAFRIEFPAFANVIKYPDALLQSDWDLATCYISDTDYGILNGKCRYQALCLMTAHLQALKDIIASGQSGSSTVPGLVENSKIDKIEVKLTPPPVKTQWAWWLSLTGYGQELLALLQMLSVGGLFIRGLPEKLGFRRIGGIFA